GRAEPVRKLRVELSNLAGAHRDVVLTEDQPHLAAQDVQPFVTAVDAGLGLALLGRDQDLPGVDTGVALAERDDDTTVAFPGFRLDPWISDLGGGDELVERHAMRFSNR